MEEPLAVISIIAGIGLIPVLLWLTIKRRTRAYAATVLVLSSLLGAAGCVGAPQYCVAMFLMLFTIGALAFGAIAIMVAIIIAVVTRVGRKHAA